MLSFFCATNFAIVRLCIFYIVYACTAILQLPVLSPEDLWRYIFFCFIRHVRTPANVE